MKFRTLTLALGLSGLLAGCDQMPAGNSNVSETATAPAINDTSAVVVTVNGIPITETVIELYQEQIQTRRPGVPVDRNTIIEEVVNLELASQSGSKAGLDKDARMQLQIDQQRRAVVATAAIQNYLNSNPVTDEELKKLYDEQVPKGSEYKARHILLEDEESAKKLVTELDGGADFSALAKEHSTGPSGKSGGELGWFSPKQMVAPFSEAAARLEKGSHTKEPVKTQFGWHIIILDDVRESTPPDFEQMKPQLQSFVQKQRVQNYISGLRQGASIEMTAAPAATEPATPESEPASSGSGEGYPE
jgi:peptidyl-prolyl cis-trans isomerase C